MSDPNEELEIVLRHLSVVRLEPGDTLVLRTSGRLSREAIRNIRESFQTHFGGHKLLVLDGGLEMAVLRGLPE